MVFINFPWEKFEFHIDPGLCFCNKIYAIFQLVAFNLFFSKGLSGPFLISCLHLDNPGLGKINCSLFFYITGCC